MFNLRRNNAEVSHAYIKNLSGNSLLAFSIIYVYEFKEIVFMYNGRAIAIMFLDNDTVFIIHIKEKGIEMITILPFAALAILFVAFIAVVSAKGYRLDMYLQIVFNESVVLAVVATGAIFIYTTDAKGRKGKGASEANGIINSVPQNGHP